jgi:DNA-binding transcriptional ArsR family regulator
MSERGDLFDRAFRLDRAVHVFDDDRDLFSELPEAARLEARSRAVVPLLDLDRGQWDPHANGVGTSAACLGLLVLDGLLVHSVAVAREPRSELVGAGDVIRPWEHEDDAASVPFVSRWEVVPLPVTHDVLAQLIGVQRPTVTSAVRRLSDAGLVTRQRDKTWLLRGEPPASRADDGRTAGLRAGARRLTRRARSMPCRRGARDSARARPSHRGTGRRCRRTRNSGRERRAGGRTR